MAELNQAMAKQKAAKKKKMGKRERKEYETIEADVEALRARCDDLDYLVARAVVAKSRGESVSPFPGGAEDSLLARFRALEEE